VSEQTQSGGRWWRRGSEAAAEPADVQRHDVAAAVEESVQAAVEESVRSAMARNPAGVQTDVGNGSHEAVPLEAGQPEPQEAEQVRDPDPVAAQPRQPDPEAVTAETPAAERGRPPASPPRPRVAGPLEAFLRHPFLALMPVLLLVGGAILIGVERKPEYTAQARITVGGSDVPPFALQTVVTGNQALAASYARVISAYPVVIDAARKVGIPPGAAAAALNASPVASSTLIQVEAKGASAAFSIGLANAASESLINYVQRVNTTNASRTLFRQYQAAQAQVRSAQRRVQAAIRSNSGAGLTKAQLAEDGAQLRASDLANRYRGTTFDAASSSRLTLIAPAAHATSDRRTMLERLIAIAAIGGIVLGLGLALLDTNWRVLRTLRRE
jgi:capsular polysaccharide biosynthesis protein